MLTGEYVAERFRALARECFDASFNKYLETLGNRSLYGYVIDGDAHTYLPFFGDPPVGLTTSIVQAGFFDSVAGYRVAVQDRFPQPLLNADVLLISKALLLAPQDEMDTILLHELCHWVIDGDAQALASLDVDEDSRRWAQCLYDSTDKDNEITTRHDLEFCTVLSASAATYASRSASLPTRAAVLRSAMRFDCRVEELPRCPD